MTYIGTTLLVGSSFMLWNYQAVSSKNHPAFNSSSSMLCFVITFEALSINGLDLTRWYNPHIYKLHSSLDNHSLDIHNRPSLIYHSCDHIHGWATPHLLQKHKNIRSMLWKTHDQIKISEYYNKQDPWPISKEANSTQKNPVNLI